jgi:hypothetical protein
LISADPRVMHGQAVIAGTRGFSTFWQYADSGSLPGDQDVFNGYHWQLKKLAKAG